MNSDIHAITGLTEEEVLISRRESGNNLLDFKKENRFLAAIKSIAKEPMVILLLIASFVYFISGKINDGIFLCFAILMVAAISLFQDSRSRNALSKLKDFTQPMCKVIRSGKIISIKIDELVIGDCLIVEEGSSIAADGKIIQSNDFSVNESVLTGESLPVFKDSESKNNQIFRGTNVTSGLAIARITQIGLETKLGKIGKSLESIEEEKTPLELQIHNFVKKMVILGAAIFIIVWFINFKHSKDVLDSLLKALTLAMSILPEEIPVAFTTFMALGAWRLMKLGIVVKQMKTVETLGSATVICTDKTGTITENKMSLVKVYSLKSNTIFSEDKFSDLDAKDVIRLSMWASEPLPFDPMEVALHNSYSKYFSVADERPTHKLVHEYPLGGTPPMMTHVFEDQLKHRIIAAKGAPEALITVSALNKEQEEMVNTAMLTLTTEGYRVLGVASTDFSGDNYPQDQQEFKFTFKGLVAFYDPPKKNINSVLESFYNAGINVKIITGDNQATSVSIAKQIGFHGYDQTVTGEKLMAWTDQELNKKVGTTTIFSRMFPDAKLRVINALKDTKEIVAMTGDGVNDGPALKAAHIGVAMGKKGTEIAREAASLVLLEDDLSKMVDAIAMGRKIYSNLKKAIRYIISIHIPIILTVFTPLVLGWIYPNIFSPVHIIFLELIMGPTCSIIYENEPMERDIMNQKPRPMTTTFFNWKELTISIIQGILITIGILSVYQYGVSHAYPEKLIRTMAFTTLIAANIFLTLVNRSFEFSIWTTLKYKNNLVMIIIGLTIIITGLILYVDPLVDFFTFEKMSIIQLLICITTGFLSVIWFEPIKWMKRKIS